MSDFERMNKIAFLVVCAWAARAYIKVLKAEIRIMKWIETMREDR